MAKRSEEISAKDLNESDKYGDRRLVISLFGYHAGGVLIAVVMCLSLTFFMVDTGGQLLVQLLVLFGYGFPVYSMLWTIGHRDFNKFSFGHIKRNQYRGFKLGALAAIPIALIGVAFIIISLSKFTWAEWSGPIYRILNGHVWPLLNMVAGSTSIVELAWWQLTAFAILPSVLLIAMSGLSYILGNHDFSPLEKIMYKSKKKTSDKKKEKKKSYDVI